MSKEFFCIGDSADKCEICILPITDPFAESQRSKSAEHSDRFATEQNFQKTEKNGEITS